MPSKNDKEGVISVEKENGLIHDKHEIANEFNNFFVNVGVAIQQQTSQSANNIIKPSKKYQKFVKSKLATFSLKTVSVKEVRDILMTLPDKKSCGRDNLPVSLLKPVVDIILKPLVYIINMSINSDEVPSRLKISRVHPIYKNGNRSHMTNYRPISVLPITAKILEKLVFNQLYTYFNDNYIINVNQSGFRPGHSTLTALLKVTEDWLHSMDLGKIIGMATIDLRKAFDTVDHSILIDKLRLNGLDDHTCKWFESYLSDRVQYTMVNGIESSAQDIKCGVPQGSNLGPLLFMLFINDLPNCLEHCCVALYADDTCIYCPGDKLADIEIKLNEDLQNISEWLLCNRLALNAKKCEAMLIGSQRRTKNKILSLRINATEIGQVSSCKYLGVFIDSCLSWDKHVEYLCKSTVKNLYLLKRIRHCLSQETALLFYKTIAQSKLDYCDIVWNNTKKKNTQKLQILQNRLLKTVLCVESRYSTHLIYESLSLDMLDLRRTKHTLCLMYKIVANLTPEYLNSKFELKPSSYHLRNNLQILSLPRLNTCFKKNSLTYHGAKLWNGLQSDFKLKPTYDSFKNYLNRNFN